MLINVRKITFRLLPVVITIGFLTLIVRVNHLNKVWEPISLAQAQDNVQEKENSNSSDESIEKDDLGEATLQDALDEDAKLADGPARPVFTPAELDVLENLSARRKILEARSQELDIRENLLTATQMKVEKKIDELKKIEQTIRILLGQHDEQEELKLRSLVKVYEAMKPKDAAKIFEELDLTILVDVAELMEERRLAPVLANMDPVKAKSVTTEIRTRRKLPKQDTEKNTEKDNLAIDKGSNDTELPSG